ncbi:MAG TPA: hypothetical protein VK957_10010 [Lunatimonas sp.]|nr:hypothetical protein [Lunatimonas sp.]
MINLPMHWSIFHFCLFLGLILSASYFSVKKSKQEYTLIHQVVFAVLLTTVASEIIWQSAMASISESFLLYNVLFVYLRIALMLTLIYFLPFSCAIQNKIILSVAIFLVAGFINSIWIQPLETGIQSYTQMFGNSIILLFSLIFFKDIFRQNRFKNTNLLSLPYFWIATFILFSYGESFIFYFFSTIFFPVHLNNLGFVQMFVQFFAGLMFLVFGVAFYIPEVFKK